MRWIFRRKEKLKEVNGHLLKISARIIQAGDSSVHNLDFYILSVINRAISLNKAFLLLLKDKNSLTAISIVRLQLDNVLRLNAVKVAKDRDEFLNHFFSDKPINKYQESGQKFTDYFLATELDKENSGTLDLYHFLCDFVHFSNKHFEAAKTASKNEKAYFRFVVGNSNILNEEQIKVYYHNMMNISNSILRISKEWINTKNIN